MVIRTRLHRILQAAALYALAAVMIAYFGFHAYHGDHGIRAKQQFLAEIADLNTELQALRREKAEVDRRVVLMRTEALDPDMLDQRAREILNFADPRELILIERRR
ncbi:FtsB family cell division protein [Phreatobacter stygius]|uniref:Septum formation initiator family protein n=1 Tax=Phreatobacter stygius TaxID=1940610 RepID=A0A4D7BC51_9HYPH|nr:septum formation initiator family protein [Phreatobacter stygius]QCI68213.1 septum formation initiator family protein [Phreatobacter stygius]